MRERTLRVQVHAWYPEALGSVASITWSPEHLGDWVACRLLHPRGTELKIPEISEQYVKDFLKMKTSEM